MLEASRATFSKQLYACKSTIVPCSGKQTTTYEQLCAGGCTMPMYVRSNETHVHVMQPYGLHCNTGTGIRFLAAVYHHL